MHSGDLSRPLQIYWFWDFCWGYDLLWEFWSLTPHPCLSGFLKCLEKLRKRFFFTKNKAVKEDPNVYLELHFWCNTKLRSRLNRRPLPYFTFFLMVKGYESGGERVHPLHPPAFGIWQSIINPNSFIHSFIPSIKIYCNS